MLEKHVLHVPGRTVTLRCDPAFAAQARAVLGLIEGALGRGRPLEDGFTVGLGWSTLTLRERGREFRIVQPDFFGDPFRDETDDVTASLTMYSCQQRVLALARVPAGTPTPFHQSVTIEKGALEEARVQVARRPPDALVPDDSGWSVLHDLDRERREPEAGATVRVSTIHLLGRRPQLIHALGLPVGWVAFFHHDEISELCDPEGWTAWSEERR